MDDRVFKVCDIFARLHIHMRHWFERVNTLIGETCVESARDLILEKV